jgi:hypothetical protein
MASSTTAASTMSFVFDEPRRRPAAWALVRARRIAGTAGAGCAASPFSGIELARREDSDRFVVNLVIVRGERPMDDALHFPRFA